MPEDRFPSLPPAMTKPTRIAAIAEDAEDAVIAVTVMEDAEDAEEEETVAVEGTATINNRNVPITHILWAMNRP